MLYSTFLFMEIFSYEYFGKASNNRPKWYTELIEEMFILLRAQALQRKELTKKADRATEGDWRARARLQYRLLEISGINNAFRRKLIDEFGRDNSMNPAHEARSAARIARAARSLGGKDWNQE